MVAVYLLRMCKMNELKQAVDGVLSAYEDARNNDHFLIFRVYESMGFSSCVDRMNVTFYISMTQLNELPSCESITRLRRQIQNVEKRYLPTDLDVLIKRKFTDEDLRIFFGEQSSLYNDYKFIMAKGDRA